jgi:hypothetical protein
VVSEELDRSAVRFQPLRPASPTRLVVAFVLGPVLWLVALIILAALLNQTRAIALGLLIAFASLLGATLVLALLYVSRRRQEKRFAHRR